MFKTIVTGATGLVGAHLLVELVKKKCHVVALKRSTSNVGLVEKIFEWYKLSQEDFKNYITWHEADITDIASLENVIEENANVYHCAAQVSFIANDRESLMKVNAAGTANVVNVCLQKKINKLCYVSSVSTLSVNKGETTIHENSFWKNIGNETAYAQSKYLAEMEVWRGMEEGLKAVMVNPSVIIGPHNFEKGSAKMIETAAKGLKYYTNGISGFVNATDVAKVLILLMESNIESERFILNSSNVSYRQFFITASNLLGKPIPTILVKPWLSGIAWRFEKLKSMITRKEPLITKETATAAMNHRLYDASKIMNELNFTFTTVDDTLKNACNFYLENNSTN